MTWPTPREAAAESFPWKHVAEPFNDSPIAGLLRDHGEYMATGGEGMPRKQLARLRGFYLTLRDKRMVVEFRPALGGYTYRARRDADGDLIIRVNELAEMTPTAEVIWRFPPSLPFDDEEQP